MNNEARDRVTEEIAEDVLNIYKLSYEYGPTVTVSACMLKKALSLAIERGYRAARDESLRILSRKREQDYDA